MGHYFLDTQYLTLSYNVSYIGPDMIEGQFAMIASNNYEQFLEAVGTGPLSRSDLGSIVHPLSKNCYPHPVQSSPGVLGIKIR